jgi:hypothetical protein
MKKVTAAATIAPITRLSREPATTVRLFARPYPSHEHSPPGAAPQRRVVASPLVPFGPDRPDTAQA